MRQGWSWAGGFARPAAGERPVITPQPVRPSFAEFFGETRARLARQNRSLATSRGAAPRFAGCFGRYSRQSHTACGGGCAPIIRRNPTDQRFTLISRRFATAASRFAVYSATRAWSQKPAAAATPFAELAVHYRPNFPRNTLLTFLHRCDRICFE
jgi:hypothetical protein